MSLITPTSYTLLIEPRGIETEQLKQHKMKMNFLLIEPRGIETGNYSNLAEKL